MSQDKHKINSWAFWNWLLTQIASDFASISTWGFMFVFIVASVLCWFGKINSTSWGLVISIGFGLFLSYHATKKHIGKKTDGN